MKQTNQRPTIIITIHADGITVTDGNFTARHYGDPDELIKFFKNNHFDRQGAWRPEDVIVKESEAK